MSVRELNFINPKRSPKATCSPARFQQTILLARIPAICLHTIVILSPLMVRAFCSLIKLEFSLVAIKNFPRV
jgi:hypothetical protein